MFWIFDIFRIYRSNQKSGLYMFLWKRMTMPYYYRGRCWTAWHASSGVRTRRGVFRGRSCRGCPPRKGRSKCVPPRRPEEFLRLRIFLKFEIPNKIFKAHGIQFDASVDVNVGNGSQWHVMGEAGTEFVVDEQLRQIQFRFRKSLNPPRIPPRGSEFECRTRRLNFFTTVPSAKKLSGVLFIEGTHFFTPSSSPPPLHQGPFSPPIRTPPSHQSRSPFPPFPPFCHLCLISASRPHSPFMHAFKCTFLRLGAVSTRMQSKRSSKKRTSSSNSTLQR